MAGVVSVGGSKLSRLPCRMSWSSRCSALTTYLSVRFAMTCQLRIPSSDSIVQLYEQAPQPPFGYPVSLRS